MSELLNHFIRVSIIDIHAARRAGIFNTIVFRAGTCIGAAAHKEADNYQGQTSKHFFHHSAPLLKVFVYQQVTINNSFWQLGFAQI